MIVVLKPSSSDTEVQQVVGDLRAAGLQERLIASAGRILVVAGGDCTRLDVAALERYPAVEHVVPTVGSDSPAAAVWAVPRRAVALRSGGPVIGEIRVGVIAGPCSVEDEAQLLEAARAVRDAGALGLRGGAFKPRTNPYSFQGLGERALEMLAKAREATGLAVVTEVMSSDQVELVGTYADVLQVGTRNMHNFSLLAAVGAQRKPVLLKRGWSATLDEFLHAAEYIINAGNPNVLLCERGIRTFERHVRNTLSLATVPAIKQRSALPILVDPSQGTGLSDLVPPMSCAAVACGADGLLIEVHPDPARALTDGPQSLDIPQFQALMTQLRAVAAAVGRLL